MMQSSGPCFVARRESDVSMIRSSQLRHLVLRIIRFWPYIYRSSSSRVICCTRSPRTCKVTHSHVQLASRLSFDFAAACTHRLMFTVHHKLCSRVCTLNHACAHSRSPLQIGMLPIFTEVAQCLQSHRISSHTLSVLLFPGQNKNAFHCTYAHTLLPPGPLPSPPTLVSTPSRDPCVSTTSRGGASVAS